MSRNSKAIPEVELQAYVDGRLDDSRHDRVASAIASDPELGRRVEQLRRLVDALHANYDSVLDEPVPPEMLRAVIIGGPSPLLRLAAVAAWMTLGGLIGGLLVSQIGSEPGAETVAVRPLPREAAYAHAIYVPEVRHPVEVGADQRDHLNAWLSKRLAAPVVAPDIREAGYQLVGGRLLPDSGRPAAQFMYEDMHGTRLTLYIRAHENGARETALHHAEDGGIGVVYWIDGSLAYALAGKIDRARLQLIAEEMYRALNP